MHLPVAMHMANELLDLPVAVITLVAAGACVVLAGVFARRRLDAETWPLTGVLGAFVFAAQMINVTLPGMPGTSGHLGGGVLLAILLGPGAAILTMAAILIVQCLLFQDGGLLALGCNIINMGVVPCLLGWGLYRFILGAAERASAARQYIATWAACLVGVTAGAALVPIEASVAGVLKVSVWDFLAVMIGVHLLIGLLEGAVTFAVVAYLRQVRPALLGLQPKAVPAGRRFSRRGVLVSLIVTAALLGGVVSWFASSHPDGLEWSYIEREYAESDAVVENASPAVASVDTWQSRWSPMSDYSRRSAPLGEMPGEEEVEEAEAAWPAVDGWGSAAGLIGTAVTLMIVYLVAIVLRKRSAAVDV